MISRIEWAGISSDLLRVRVERYPDRILPKKSQTTVQVAGRNGDLLFVDGSFENYVQEYEVFISAERRGLVALARDVATWLESPAGYQRLEDSYEPDVYRMAYYDGENDIESILNRFGRATISFHCKPQRFLKSGEQPKTFTASGTLVNATRFDALPLIKVNGSGTGALTINSTAVTLSDIDGYVMLDSDVQDAYKGAVNKNATITAAEFPRLTAGTNTIAFSGGISSVEITPRWWTI